MRRISRYLGNLLVLTALLVGASAFVEREGVPPTQRQLEAVSAPTQQPIEAMSAPPTLMSTAVATQVPTQFAAPAPAGTL